MKIPIFPGKYHQNGGFSMAMLVYRRVNIDFCLDAILWNPNGMGCWNSMVMEKWFLGPRCSEWDWNVYPTFYHQCLMVHFWWIFHTWSILGFSIQVIFFGGSLIRQFLGIPNGSGINGEPWQVLPHWDPKVGEIWWKCEMLQDARVYMGVSKNNGTPQSSILIGLSSYPL